MRILCIGYRSWALKIYKYLVENYPQHEFHIIKSNNEYSEKDIEALTPDLILCYGWSWKISHLITSKYTCLMLHPSALPKYRGGSPLQNQIISGIRFSKATIFIMNEAVDSGDIIAQEDLCLDGDMEEIFDRLEFAGISMSKKLLNDGISNRIKQDEREATYCQRRTPKESEITIEEILYKDAEYIYNKIRMLGDPYPNAYIRTVDNKKILLKKVELFQE